MADVQLDVVLRHVRKLVDPPIAEQSDGQLLDRFVHRRDESAFDALLSRHGPLVLGVCRRLLVDEADAADAFQATFLVLIRRARSVRRSAALGSWLYGVAYRVALKMRRAAARRRTHEAEAASMSPATSKHDVTTDDLRTAVDRELSQLPEKYRAALVACYLQGRTHAEAAEHLGWPRGSFAKRLTRGLKLLRGRLMRRGVVLTAAGLSAIVSGEASAVPPALARTTLQAALLAAAGRALTGAVSVHVLSTVEGTMRDLLLTRFKTVAILALGLLLIGAGVASLGGAPPAPEVPAAEPEKPAAKPKPKLDADGDPLPDGAFARLGSLRLRHGSPVTSVAFSPDGKLLATGSWDNTVLIWDAATGRLIRAIHPQDGWIWGVAFSPDSQFLVTAGDHRSKRLRLWNVATGKSVRSFEGHTNAIRDLSYSPDGKTIASAAHDGTVRIWDAATGNELRQFAGGDGPQLRSVAYSPDGKRLATTDTGARVHLWEADSGKAAGSLSADQGGLVSAAWSKDGTRVVAGSEDGTVYMWDVASGKQSHKVSALAKAALSVAFAPDGKTFAAGYGDWNEGSRDLAGGAVVLWDAAAGKEVRRLDDQVAPVQAIAFAPDGKALAAVTLNSSVLIWDPATGRRQAGSSGHQAAIRAVLFGSGRTLLTAGNDRTVRVWDLGRNEPRLVLGEGKAAFPALAVSPDRTLLAWGGLDGVVRLCDAVTGKERRRFEGHEGHVWCVAFSPDGQTLASGGADRSIRLWDTGTGKELRKFEGHANWVLGMAFAPAGRLLASGSLDKSVRLWDVASGKEVRKLDGHLHEVSVVAFSPDGRSLASASRDDSVRLWEVATGQLRKQFGSARIGRAAVAFSPDGRYLLTANSDQDRGLRIWDAIGGRELCKVWGHRGFVESVAFSADGRTAASASDDSTVLLWDVASLRGPAAPPRTLAAVELEALWSDLIGEDAARAYTARGTLAAAPEQVLPLLRNVLRPIPALDATAVARLIKQLDDDDFEMREKASAELEKLAGPAEAELRKALERTPSAEVRERLKRVLDTQGHGPSLERLHQERALELLEITGTSEARKLLAELAKGAPQAWLTREAQLALDRLAKR
jgi:RNA polymerase sigma factor (sigma-70 family)